MQWFVMHWACEWACLCWLSAHIILVSHFPFVSAFNIICECCCYGSRSLLHALWRCTSFSWVCACVFFLPPLHQYSSLVDRKKPIYLFIIFLCYANTDTHSMTEQCAQTTNGSNHRNPICYVNINLLFVSIVLH